MAFDYRSELTRPTTLVLLSLAFIGWFVAAVALIGQSQSRSRYRGEIRQLSNAQSSLKSELDQQRQASRSLADLHAKIEFVQQQIQQTEAARLHAQEQASAAQWAQTEQRRLAEEAKQAADEQIRRLNDLQGATQLLEERAGALRSETSTLAHSIAARSQELAGADRRLEDTRRLETKAREGLVTIEQEVTARTAELAQAEQRLLQVRELEARLQIVPQETADAEARKQLVVPQSPTTPTEDPPLKQ